MNAFGDAVDWRGQRGRATSGGLPSARLASGPSAFRQAIEANQRKAVSQFWSPSRTVEVVQSVGMDRRGSPVSAFNSMHFAGVDVGPGLAGYWSTVGCTAHEQAMDAIKEGLRRAEAKNLQNRNEYIQAKAYFDNNPVVYPWTCEENTAEAGLIAQKLNALLGNDAAPIPPSVAEQLFDAEVKTKPPEEMSATAKFAIIGGITVVGIIGVAYITGQLAPLLKALR